jgi:sec-independent protein translocase protein TatA
MFAGFFDSPAEIGIILLVVLLLFGGSQLPKLAKNIGKAQKEFKDGLSEGQKAAAGPEGRRPGLTPPTQSKTRNDAGCPRAPASLRVR